MAGASGALKVDFPPGVHVSAKVKESPYAIQVTILGARGLRNADFVPGLGLSDPYCVCAVIGKPHMRIQTPVVDDDLDPAWNFSKDLPDYTVGDQLKFEVWDKDQGKKDDFLGHVSLDIPPPPGKFHGELRLEEAGKGIQAFISVKVSVAARGAVQLTTAGFAERAARLPSDFEGAWARTFFFDDATGYGSEVILKYPFKKLDQHRFNVRKLWKQMVSGIDGLGAMLRAIEPRFASCTALFTSIGNALSVLNSPLDGIGGPQLSVPLRAGLAQLREDRKPPRQKTFDAELFAFIGIWQEHAAGFCQELQVLDVLGQSQKSTDQRMRCLRSASFFAKGIASLLIGLVGSIVKLENELKKCRIVVTDGEQVVTVALVAMSELKVDMHGDPDLMAQRRALTVLLNKVTAAREDQTLVKLERETHGFDREQMLAWMLKQAERDPHFLQLLEVHTFTVSCESSATQKDIQSLLTALSNLQAQIGLIPLLFGRRGQWFGAHD